MAEDSINSGKVAKFGFSKAERICSKKLITNIFEKGAVVYLHPLKLFFLENNYSYDRIFISVPKRNFKKAVDRNLIKRRIREAFRLNKTDLDNTVTVDIAIVYISNEIQDFEKISSKVSNALAKVKQNITKS